MMQHTSVLARLLPGLYLATAFLIPPSWAEEPKPSTPPTTPAAETSALPETIISSTGPQTPESIVIGEVAPRALKIDAPIADLPRSVTVITRQQFEDRGVLTVQDALLYTPGVYGAPYGFDTRGDWSLIRGVSPIDYVDGLRSLFSSYNNTRPHPYSLSSVEVIKGPSSVLFGQSSLGGILHSSSKLPLTRPYNEIFVSYGSFDRLESGIDVGGKEGPLSWRLVTAKRESNTQVDHVSDNTAFISPSFTWEYAEESSLTFLGNFQEARTGTSAQFAPWEGTILPGRNIPSSRFLSEPGFDRYNTGQNAFTGILEHRLNDIFKVEGRARYTTGGADYRSIWPAFPPTISADGIINRTLYISDATSEAFVSDVRLRAEYETGAFRHNTSLGFDYQHADTDNDFHYSYFGGGPFNIYNPLYGQNALDIAPVVDYASTEFEQTGIYLNHRIELGDHWIGSVGARYDELTSVTDDGSPEQFDNAFTFDAGLMYRFKNGIAPYVSYAESFLPVAGTDLNNNPYEPQQGRQYETGIKFQPEGTSNLFTLAFFDTIEQNRLTASPTGVGSVQTGEVSIQGVELESLTKWNDFYVQAGYSYLDAEISSSNDGDEGFKVASVPENQFMTWLTWRPSGTLEGFKAGFGVRHVGPSWDGSDTIQTEPYTLFDAMVGYETGAWDFTLNATNLEDEEHITTALSRGDVFFGQQRFVGATVRYRF